jgi:hypothetical protein
MHAGLRRARMALHVVHWSRHLKVLVVFCSYRSLQKYMHEFHADRNHAMCNIQNLTIPVVQLTQLQKTPTKIVWGTGVLKSLQSCQVLQYKVAAQAMEVPG